LHPTFAEWQRIAPPEQQLRQRTFEVGPLGWGAVLLPAHDRCIGWVGQHAGAEDRLGRAVKAGVDDG
jgi:hypothetical protein